MVTPILERKLTEGEKAQGFTDVVFVRSAEPTLGRGSKEIVSGTTGETIGNIPGAEFRNRQLGARKFRGELFVTVPARAKVEASIRRREEKQETKELAKKEAEFEAKRIAEGKIKAKDVVLTQRGSKVILTRLLQEQAQKELRERLQAPPTREERIREVERKQRIVKTLKRQEAVRREAERPKAPLELFSEKAIEQLGLGETPQGLLEITLREEEKALKIPEKKMLPFKITFSPGIEEKRRGELERIVRRKFSEQPGLFRKTKGIEFISGVLTSKRGIKALGIANLNTDTFKIAVISGRPNTIEPTITHEATHLLIPNLVSRVLPDPLEEFISERAEKKVIPGRIGEAPLLPELEIPGRKLVVERGEILAEIPVSAEFRKGFEQFIGKGFKEEDLFGLKTPSGVLTFGTIGEIAKEKIEKAEEKVRPISQELLEFTPFDIQKALAERELEELKGREGAVASARRAVLKSKIVSLTVPERIFRQVREEPVESAIFFGAGFGVTAGLTAFGLTQAPIIVKSTKALETLFFTGVAVEAGIQVGKGAFEEAVGITTERITEAGLFVGGGIAASTLIQAVRPSKVRVLKAKELRAAFAETLETKGTSAKNLQRLGLKTEVRTRVTRFKRGVQTRIIKTPKDPAKLAKLLEDPRVRFEFRIIEGAAKQVLVREIPPTVVRPKIAPEPFELRVDGKLGLRLREVTIRTDLFDVRVGDITGVVDVKDLSRVIDPTLFKRISIKGLPKDVTVLQREFGFDIDRLPFDVRGELLGRGLITGKVKPVKQVADIFGIDLFPPEVITTFRPVTTRLGFKPIIGVTTLFEPSPALLFPSGLLDIFGRRERRVREPIIDRFPKFDITTELGKISDIKSIQEAITKKDVISDIAQIVEQVRKGKRVTKPIIDLGLAEAELPIVDVIPKRKQERVIDVVSISDLITEVIPEPKPKPTPPIIAIFKREKVKEKVKKGRFEGYNSFVKGRKGRQLKVNLKRTLTKKSALSASARVVDTSLSASGSIKKVISKNPPINTRDNYFQNNRSKFRTFKIRKGKRIPLKNRFIELRGKRLDTPQEVNKIQAAKRISQVRKKLLKFEIFEEPKRKKKRRRGIQFF